MNGGSASWTSTRSHSTLKGARISYDSVQRRARLTFSLTLKKVRHACIKIVYCLASGYMLSFLLEAYCSRIKGYLDRSAVASSNWVITLISSNLPLQKRQSMNDWVLASKEADIAFNLFSSTKDCRDPLTANQQFNLAKGHLQRSASLLPERRDIISLYPPIFR